MVPLTPNPQLAFRTEDFGLVATTASVQMPLSVFAFCRRLGAFHAELLVPTLETWPSAFMTEFHLTREAFESARERIADLLRQRGVRWEPFVPQPRAFGAMPPLR